MEWQWSENWGKWWAYSPEWDMVIRIDGSVLWNQPDITPEQVARQLHYEIHWWSYLYQDLPGIGICAAHLGAAAAEVIVVDVATAGAGLAFHIATLAYHSYHIGNILNECSHFLNRRRFYEQHRRDPLGGRRLSLYILRGLRYEQAA